MIVINYTTFLVEGNPIRKKRELYPKIQLVG